MVLRSGPQRAASLLPFLWTVLPAAPPLAAQTATAWGTHSRAAWLPGLAPERRAAGCQEDGRMEAVRRLEEGQRIRVRLSPGRTERGRFRRLDGSDLVLAEGAGERALPVASIERLWVRGRATRAGALWGGIAGLALGAAYGAAIGGFACAEAACSELEVAAVMGVIGGAGGAGLGALVGTALPVWRSRFP